MNKDKQEDKDMKTKKVASINEAIEILLIGYRVKMVETQKFTPTSEDVEVSLYNEIMFAAKQAKIDLRRKRMWLFLSGMFLFTRENRLKFKKQYKALYVACKYITRHKKELKRHISLLQFGIMDPNSTWLRTSYRSGDNVNRRMRPDGSVEMRIGNGLSEFPEYRQIPSSILRNSGENKTAGEKFEQRQNRFQCSPTEEDKFLQTAQDIIDIVSELMSNNTSGPFKGEAEFRKNFIKCAGNTIKEAAIIQPYTLSEDAQIQWRQMLDRAMYKAWKKRLENSSVDLSKAENSPEIEISLEEGSLKDKNFWLKGIKCIENLKNSSTPKDDDSQS